MVLSDQLRKCDWLTDSRKNLCQCLDSVEAEILRSGRKTCPAFDSMLKCFTELTAVPNLVIVGQDPYPNEKATGIAFQTNWNQYSTSLECMGKGLGLPGYPDLGFWVSHANVLLMNAAMCNFGDCHEDEIFSLWHDFTVGVLRAVRILNKRSVFMLIGKEKVWPLWQDGDKLVLKVKHPSHGHGPTKQEWTMLRGLLQQQGVDCAFMRRCIPRNFDDFQ